MIELKIPAEAFSAELTVWPDGFPAGPRISSSIDLSDYPGADQVYGAQVRLKNLGYFSGPFGDEMTEDLALALQRFQGDHLLAMTGELDGDTATKLVESHRK